MAYVGMGLGICVMWVWRHASSGPSENVSGAILYDQNIQKRLISNLIAAGSAHSLTIETGKHSDSLEKMWFGRYLNT